MRAPADQRYNSAAADGDTETEPSDDQDLEAAKLPKQIGIRKDRIIVMADRVLARGDEQSV